jgi:hypothetical protein
MSTILRRYHLMMVFVWLALSWPGTTIWRESILFVIICSLYANIEGSFAAYMGARAEKKQEKNDDESK